MTYLENLNKHIESKNYTERNMLHFYRDVLAKGLNSGFIGENIFSSIYNYIKREQENEIKYNNKTT